MKQIKKFTAVALSVLLFIGMVTPAYAASAPAPKQEVIYVMTDASGKVTDIEAVNIFAGGDITDYGDYSAVKILNTTDEIHQKKNKINISSDVDKIYYQGTMNSTVIPWNISIDYFLDGKEYAPSDIAGKSGALEIRFSVSKNEECAGDFYENYALQVSFTMDTEKCSNITADGATLANVGENKQISYTVLPGKGLRSVMKADVTDFEMDAVEINGIKLNLNVEIDDAELMEKVTQLMEASKKLNEGAGSLNTGAGTLKVGSASLLNGSGNLNSGASELDSGIRGLQNGVSAMQAGLDTLDSKSSTLTAGSAEMKAALETLQGNLNDFSVSTDQIALLIQSSAAIRQGISDLYDGVANLQSSLSYAQYKALMNQNGLDIDALKAGNDAAIVSLSQQISDMETTLSQISGVPGYESQVAQLQEQISSLQDVITLLNGNQAAIGGTETYLNGVSAGVTDLYDGVSALKSKYDEFDAAISTLANTLGDMLVKMTALTDGVNTLVAKYTELDAGITEYTNGVAAVVSGYGQITGGVSELAQGSKKLLDGAGALNAGASELYNGAVSLYSGTSELADGTSELYANTDGMDTQAQEKIDEILASIGGEETETVSFVSDKNPNVDSVQFVIKTSAVEKAEAAEMETTQTETLNFWEKVLRLFDIN